MTIAINCTWSTPHTVSGITIDHYTVNITFNENDQLQVLGTTVVDTKIEYTVSEFGEYNVSVAAVIGEDLFGVTDTVQVQVDEGYYCKN